MNKQERIDVIKRIIGDYGSFSICDVDNVESPVINTIGKDSFQLADKFFEDFVSTTTYVHETAISEDNIPYEDLSTEVIDDIYIIVKEYEFEQIEHNV